MQFGINTYLFSPRFTTESTSLFPLFKQWGYDGVEIALEEATDIDPVGVKRALDEHGLTCRSLCAVLGPGRDLRGTEPEQQAALRYLLALLELMPRLGNTVLIGPLYSAVGRADLVPPDEYQQQWETVATHLKVLAAKAEALDVTLALEPLNRYETDFINTCEQALRLIEEVGSPALKVHLDTFHMNLEEKDPAAAILRAGNRLGHVHASGSDRGTPGGDQINWDRIFLALKQVNYTGEVVIESFTPDVKVIAKAASIWRQVEPSPQAIAVEGLRFLQAKAQLHGI
ncbi:sugar phosphate isomerase/epimerase [Rhabdobacter roseus]|uniref:D-psicose/D-tagatose/L-ribulose 3-epimerase n=1 Tax=Rhabdobacter roseus TaxID=1655419 RepID=A0A840U0S0_9BACT|nr:sugar phosphate isomerase/epimerase [Rhabdobacter roseus]MBB5285469.1 D-psicose/D-tagatose/L-ribulose 3-epimerase [Rhabdobacter roseus]